jgi:hypothetical protein
MSAENQNVIVAEVICPECRAQIPPNALYCWLCGRPIDTRPPKPQQAAANRQNESSSQVVLWVLIAVAGGGVLHLAATAPVLLNDRAFLLTAVPLAAIVLLVIGLAANSARRTGVPWNPGQTAAISILGVVVVVGVSLLSALVVTVVAAITFILTCGTSGRLPQ